MSDCIKVEQAPGCWTRVNGETENILVVREFGTGAEGQAILVRTHFTDIMGEHITLEEGDILRLGACSACCGDVTFSDVNPNGDLIATVTLANGQGVDLKAPFNPEVVAGVQATPTPTGNTTNLNSVFSDLTTAWFVDYKGNAIPLGAGHAYTREWHVDPVNGLDTNGGSELKPFKTIARAQTAITGSGDALYLHLGTYTETVNWTDLNVDIVGVSTGALTQITGAWTFAHTTASVRVRHCRFSSSITHSGAGGLYFDKSQHTGAFSKSGAGYLEIVDSDFGGTGMNLTGAGTVQIIDTKINLPTVSNAGAILVIKDSTNAVGPTASSGTMLIDGSTVFAVGVGSAAVGGQAASTVILRNSSCYKPDGSLAGVSLLGAYSLDDAQFDRSASNIAGTSLGITAEFDALLAHGQLTGSSLSVPWVQTKAFAAAVVVEKDGQLFKSNAAIPANTAFVVGTTGATWFAVSASQSNITTSLTPVVYDTVGGWVPAQADADQNVAKLIQLDDGTNIAVGKVTWTAHGLDIGAIYYLDQTTAGGYVTPAPTSGLSQQLFVVEDADTIHVDLEEAAVVGAATATPTSSYQALVTDEFAATASQTTFTLSKTPLGGVASYHNRSRLTNAAFSYSGKTATYKPASNANINLAAGDQMNFDYLTGDPLLAGGAAGTITATRYTAITPTTAYTAINFGGAITYTISPALPASLTIDSATGVISGTPAAVSANTSYTVTGTAGTQTATAAPFTLGVVAEPTVVSTPSITSPTASQTGFPLAGPITSSAFALSAGIATHASSDWQVSANSAFTAIVASVTASTTALTSWSPSGLSGTTTYYARVRHNASGGVASAWSSGTAFTTETPPVLTWTSRFSDSTESLTDVTYGASKFLVVTSGGKVLTSTTGEFWTTGTSGATTYLGAVTHSGSLFVAVGDGSAIRTSPDGVTWTQRFSGGGYATLLRDVIYGGARFVAVGHGGAIRTSPDGITWTLQSSGTSNNLNGVAYNGSLYVAVGTGGLIRTSPDGVTWTARTSGTTNSLEGIIYNGSNFVVAVGASGIMLTSPDGITWTSRSTGVAKEMLGVVFGGGRHVAVGGSGAILTSPDAITWTENASGATTTLTSAAFGGNVYVVVGVSGTIRTAS